MMKAHLPYFPNLQVGVFQHEEDACFVRLLCRHLIVLGRSSETTYHPTCCKSCATEADYIYSSLQVM